MKVLFLLVGIVIFILVIMVVIDSNRFHTVSYRIETDKIKTPFHFVFLSDMHNKSYGKNNEKLLRAIDQISPDAVLIGGDLLTARPGKTLDIACNMVKNLVGKYPLYYANGNHEQRLVLYPEKYGTMGQDYEEMLREIGVHRLINESVTLGEHNICITGCEIDRCFYKRFRNTDMGKDYLPSVLPQSDAERYHIMMAHNPEYFAAYASYGADLILSGHNHGGVVRLPKVGGVISTKFTLFPQYDGGKFEMGRSVMIVSRGLGAHTIPFRLFNPGELVDITINPVGSSCE